MMTPTQLASMYVNSYVARGHVEIQPRSLLSPLFPTGFLMSAGFEDIDALVRNDGSVPRRCVTAQPCFRYFDAMTNDDSRHLSLFLMGAALYAPGWTQEEVLGALISFLTDTAKLSSDHLWLSTFAGDEVYGKKIPADTETLRFCIEHQFPQERTVQLGQKENFWIEGGVSAKNRKRHCGPQVEVFLDLTGKPCEHHEPCLPNCACKRFLELANVISISYAIEAPDKLIQIGTPACESVLGIERLLMAIEGCTRLCDIPAMREAVYQAMGEQDHESNDALKSRFAVYEKLRAFCYLVAEGSEPSGKGRGSILRRLFRSVIASANAIPVATESDIKALATTIIKQEQEAHVRSMSVSEKRLCEIIEREFMLCNKTPVHHLL